MLQLAMGPCSTGWNGRLKSSLKGLCEALLALDGVVAISIIALQRRGVCLGSLSLLAIHDCAGLTLGGGIALELALCEALRAFD